MMQITNWLIILLVSSCCCGHNNDHSFQNSYEVIDVAKKDDCQVYAMKFMDGNDYLFRFALSGPCDNLTADEYLQFYRIFIEKKLQVKNLPDNSKAIIETYDFIPVSVDSIMHVTKEYFHVNVELIESSEFAFTMKFQKRP